MPERSRVMTQTRRDTLFPQAAGVGLTTPHRDEIMTKEAWKSDLIMATWNVRTMLTHCGRVTQICVFTLQLCRTGDAYLRF